MKKKLTIIGFIFILFSVGLNGENIHFNPQRVFIGTDVGFEIRGIPPNVSFNFKWTFGDNSPIVERNQTTVTHKFLEPGNFRVTCEIIPTTRVGERQILTVEITVQEQRTVAPEGTIFKAGIPVLFKTEHFVDNTLNWDFGDGTSNNGQKNREHTYRTPGIFTVKVKDFGGNTSSVITCTVNIVPDDRVIEFRPSSPKAGTKILFTAKNFSSDNLKWKFGNEEVSGGSTVEYTFPGAGTYEIKVTDQSLGENGFIVQRISVAPDNRSVLVDKEYIFEKSVITFTAKNFGVNNLKWDFGDGNIRNGKERITYKYMQPGNFSLKVVDQGGSSIPFILKITVRRENREIKTNNKVLFENTEVEFEGRNFISNRIKWDFGDGSVKIGQRRIKHTFSKPGFFKIHAIDFEGKDEKKISMQVEVRKDSRTISIPDNIMSGIPVNLKIRNFRGGRFEWKLPGGKIKQGDSLGSIIFNSPGVKKITIIDKEGIYPPIEKMIRVKRDNRTILVSEKQILKGAKLKLTAKNFKGNGVKWNFGDGTPSIISQEIVSHKFNSAGSFKVTAIDDGGKGKKVFSETVTVKEQLAGFKIKVVELKFANGKYFRIVPRNGFSPEYLLRLKSEGRGIVTGVWKFDGQVIGLFSKVLSGRTVINTDKYETPKLPVTESGIHSLGFEFTNYSFEGKIPILRFFITTGGKIKILFPESGAKLFPKNIVRLKWKKVKRGNKYEIAISQIPFRFLNSKNIKWISTGEKNSFDITPSSYKKGNWIYWQVRVLDATGTVSTVSDISFFKIKPSL